MNDVNLTEIGERARVAGRLLARSRTGSRNAALTEIARRLDAVGDALWRANASDLQEARAAGVSASLLDRATLNAKRVASMAQGCLDVSAPPDPIGELMDGRTLPNGLRIARRR